MENGFQGKDGQSIPEMTDEFVNSVSDRYIELYENVSGEKFVKSGIADALSRIENNVLNYLK
jgi:phosphoribosylaminoimidazole-succinocarboxamide synthase